MNHESFLAEYGTQLLSFDDDIRILVTPGTENGGGHIAVQEAGNYYYSHRRRDHLYDDDFVSVDSSITGITTVLKERNMCKSKEATFEETNETAGDNGGNYSGCNVPNIEATIDDIVNNFFDNISPSFAFRTKQDDKSSDSMLNVPYDKIDQWTNEVKKNWKEIQTVVDNALFTNETSNNHRTGVNKVRNKQAEMLSDDDDDLVCGHPNMSCLVAPVRPQKYASTSKGKQDTTYRSSIPEPALEYSSPCSGGDFVIDVNAGKGSLSNILTKLNRADKAANNRSKKALSNMMRKVAGRFLKNNPKRSKKTKTSTGKKKSDDSTNLLTSDSSRTSSSQSLSNQSVAAPSPTSSSFEESGHPTYYFRVTFGEEHKVEEVYID